MCVCSMYHIKEIIYSSITLINTRAQTWISVAVINFSIKTTVVEWTVIYN